MVNIFIYHSKKKRKYFTKSYQNYIYISYQKEKKILHKKLSELYLYIIQNRKENVLKTNFAGDIKLKPLLYRIKLISSSWKLVERKTKFSHIYIYFWYKKITSCENYFVSFGFVLHHLCY